MVKISCLIPARGGSKRLPRKNVALFKNKPLIENVIKTVTESSLFKDIWVSTDNDDIAAISRNSGALIHERPPELAGDSATVAQVCLDFVGWLRQQRGEIDHLCVVLPTAVLLQPGDLREGCKLFESGDYDFVIAVTEYFKPPFWALVEEGELLKPAFGREYFFRNSQFLPQVFADSGSFYFARTAALEREKTVYGGRLKGYKIPKTHAFDIDEPIHLQIAEFLCDYREKHEDGG